MRQQRRVTRIDRRRMRQIRTRIKINGALPKPKSTPGFGLWNNVSRKFSKSDTGWEKASLPDMIKKIKSSKQDKAQIQIQD